MIFPLLVEETAVWYGPATVTFQVQFAGDPLDPIRNDVRVKFIGDRNQREERPAYFDPSLGAWRAILYSKSPGSYRGVLTRNGNESAVEPQEGIVELKRSDAGVLPAKQRRENRWSLDTGDDWVGLGTMVDASTKPEEIERLAAAGANWLWIVDPPEEPNSEWDALMDAVERHDLYYTIRVPERASAGWRRYFQARFASSPRLVQWDSKEKVEDPWARGASSAQPWGELFENRGGPFFTPAKDYPLLKALKATLELSDWARWSLPKAWKVGDAEGIAERDRMILKAGAGAKVENAPLADGTYDLTSVNWTTGASTHGTAEVRQGTVGVKGAANTIVVLRRRL